MRQDHAVIVCGFGRHGQNLAALLEEQGLAYVALDLDPERIRQASAAGHSVVLGDAARLPSLMAAGLAHASAVVVTYDHLESALQVIALVREHAPQVPVVARARDELDMDRLRQAGAAEVVPEALEGSLMLASHALALVGVPMRRVIRIIQQQRHARYQLLRGFFHGHDDDGAEDLHHERLQTLVIPAGAKVTGLKWDTLALDLPPLRLVQWRRASGRSVDPLDQPLIEGGDVLVVSGLAEDLALLSRRIEGV
jgi:CPA2 family monovalent cation:H+ antiporter-2